MGQIVVVATTPGREHWLSDCLKSLGDREVLVLRQAGTWELGKIQWLYENTALDRFLFLHDTVVVKDGSFIDEAFSHPGSVALTNDPGWFGMFMGIYTRETLSNNSENEECACNFTVVRCAAGCTRQTSS